MKQMHYSVDIHAPKQKIWDTLWQDETFRDWAGIIDPGTYMVGELKQGSEIQYISSENGYGVTNTVEKVIPAEYLLLKHTADTQDFGKKLRKAQWTGGEESYSLSEMDGQTTLSATFDVPPELETYFTDAYPKVFARIKQLAES